MGKPTMAKMHTLKGFKALAMKVVFVGSNCESVIAGPS